LETTTTAMYASAQKFNFKVHSNRTLKSATTTKQLFDVIKAI